MRSAGPRSDLIALAIKYPIYSSAVVPWAPVDWVDDDVGDRLWLAGEVTAHGPEVVDERAGHSDRHVPHHSQGDR